MIADSDASGISPTLALGLSGHPTYIRLGKFPGKSRISLHKAEITEVRQGDFTANALLNWRDLAVEPPIPGDIYAAALPTRLIANPQFRQSGYYMAHFGEKDEVRLPTDMRFIARPVAKRGRR